MSNRNSLHNMIKFCETTQELKEYVKSPYARKFRIKRFFNNVFPYIIIMGFIILFHNIISAIIDAHFMEVIK